LNDIYLDWYHHTTNFGDALNVYLIEKLTDKKVIPVTSNTDLTEEGKKIYSCVGSILQKNFKYPVEVWGSGCMYGDRPVKKVSKIHAIRGKLSREIVIRNKISCPEIYGDPAILLPLIYKPVKVKKTHTIGLLPHYIDQNEKWVLKYKNEQDIKFINILDPIEKIIDEVNKVGYVITSSLHGLICADAYNIPSLWVEFSDKVKGNGFKFYDYFSGINYDLYTPLQLRDDKKTIYKVERYIRRNVKISDEHRLNLLKSCPFLKENFISKIYK
jgi:pyruvyltransferase